MQVNNGEIFIKTMKHLLQKINPKQKKKKKWKESVKILYNYLIFITSDLA
jgi:hypothetical protein